MSKFSYEDVLTQPERWLTDRQRRWLRPRGLFARTAHTLFYFVNLLFVRLLLRLSVDGRQHLPVSGPCIITPNHSSPLDLQILAAALPLALLRDAYWAGKESVVLRTWLRRTLSWYTRIVPVAEDATALAPAVKILERGDTLIWSPEGARSLDGELHAFKPGLGGILTKCDVPVVPVFIHGAPAAFPTGQTMPRLRARVVVRIGPPETAERLGLKDGGNEDINRVADALRQRVMQLGDQSSSG
jgi:long-chain acyl-CoA synthetase